MKRLLQKDPNRRLSFEAFFAHPFLSGQPLGRPPQGTSGPEILVEEPSSCAIEDDYVILSIPTPPPALNQPSDSGRSAQIPKHSTPSCPHRLNNYWPDRALSFSPAGLDQAVACAGREDMRAQFEADASEVTDLDTFMQEHSTSMPRDLTEPQLLYAMALCVAEVAGASHSLCSSGYQLLLIHR